MADSPGNERVTHDEIAQVPGTARPPSTGSAASYRQRAAANLPPTPRRPPSIRIRRLPSSTGVSQLNRPGSSDSSFNHEAERTGRRRSSSAPMRPHLPADLTRQATVTGTPLPALTEEVSAPQLSANAPPTTTDGHLAPPAESGGRRRSGSQRLRRLGSSIGARIAAPPAPPTAEDEYEAEIVDMLDVVGASCYQKRCHCGPL